MGQVPAGRPSTNWRWLVVLTTALAAFWMYADRICFSTLAVPIQASLGVSRETMGYALGAFFFSYALFQVPAGMFADRFGPRLALTLCIVGWSAATAATAFTTGIVGIFAVRLLLGVAEAGAYPAASRLIANWAAPEQRGRLSSIVALGGRLGGAVAPAATGFMALALVGWGPAAWSETETEGGWHAVFFVFGIAGFAVAVLFWGIVRDTPPAAVAQEMKPKARLRFQPILRSVNMWLSGVCQFGINFGWVFLVTLMPTYFKETFNTPLEDRGWMQSVPLFASCAGTLAGGLATDSLRRRFGPRWGRVLPLGFAMCACAAICSLIPFLTDPMTVLAALTLAAFLLDFGLPALWAFNQDVGSQRVAAVHGWGNMWGNLGAAVSPVMLTVISASVGWGGAFACMAAAFLVAAFTGLMLDATRPVDDPPNPVTRNSEESTPSCVGV